MVATGLDIFLENIERYRNRTIGMIVNQTSVTSDLRYSWNVLRENGLKIRKIFSPEHGLFATEQDQIAVGNQQPAPDFEVISLYGCSADTLIPESAMLGRPRPDSVRHPGHRRALLYLCQHARPLHGSGCGQGSGNHGARSPQPAWRRSCGRTAPRHGLPIFRRNFPCSGKARYDSRRTGSALSRLENARYQANRPANAGMEPVDAFS